MTQQNPTDQMLRDAGYLLAIDFGVDVNETAANNRQNFQDWIDWARSHNNQPTFLHGNASPYLIDDTLRLFRHGNIPGSGVAHNSYEFFGGYPRPTIKIAASAPNFDNAADPRPILAFRQFLNTDGTTPWSQPTHPLDNPPGWIAWSVGGFGNCLHNVILDTSGHDGAVGLYYSGAQWNRCGTVKVIATGSPVGIWNLPGPGCASTDIEIIGGDIGLKMGQGKVSGEGPIGAVVAGLKIDGATIPLVRDYTGGACMIVGFEFLNCPSTVYTVPTIARTEASLALVDGRIQIVGGGNPLAIDNAQMKNLYLRNIYVTGTTNLVKSGSNSTLTGSGTWARVVEYAANDPDGAPPYASGEQVIRTYSILNGVKSFTTQEPVKSAQSSVADPTSVVRTRHNPPPLPHIDDGLEYEDVVLDHGAVPGSTNNSRAAIQAAIAAAETNGHNRVFLRNATFGIGENPAGGYGIRLAKDTQLFGASAAQEYGATLWTHSSWTPETGFPYLLDTTDDEFGIASLSTLRLMVRRNGGTGGTSTVPYSQDRFNNLRWRNGRNSWTWGFSILNAFIPVEIVTNARHEWEIVGGGGGRHYSYVGLDKSGGHVDWRSLYIFGTDEPLLIYGPNCEAQKIISTMPREAWEVTGAENVRFYGVKKEGRATQLRVTDSQNVAIFGYSTNAQLTQPDHIEFFGDSNNLLAALIMNNDAPVSATNYQLVEDLDATALVGVTFPEGVSIYKRGEIDDAALWSPPAIFADVAQIVVTPNPATITKGRTVIAVPAQLVVTPRLAIVKKGSLLKAFWQAQFWQSEMWAEGFWRGVGSFDEDFWQHEFWESDFWVDGFWQEVAAPPVVDTSTRFIRSTRRRRSF
jgi:hypothetical protein